MLHSHLAAQRNPVRRGDLESRPTGLVAPRRLSAGFTRDYAVKLLVWFEQLGTMGLAIQREKRIKKWNRAWKLALIEKHNPDWDDLAVELGFEALG